jgi:hypothetical protein
LNRAPAATTAKYFGGISENVSPPTFVGADRLKGNNMVRIDPASRDGYKINWIGPEEFFYSASTRWSRETIGVDT